LSKIKTDIEKCAHIFLKKEDYEGKASVSSMTNDWIATLYSEEN